MKPIDFAKKFKCEKTQMYDYLNDTNNIKDRYLSTNKQQKTYKKFRETLNEELNDAAFERFYNVRAKYFPKEVYLVELFKWRLKRQHPN